MNFYNKKLAITSALIFSIFITPVSLIGAPQNGNGQGNGQDNGNGQGNGQENGNGQGNGQDNGNGQGNGQDNGNGQGNGQGGGVSPDSSVVPDSSVDYFIAECEQAREQICEQIYAVDSSYFNDSSDIIEAGDTALTTICASYFSDPANTSKKMKICHNGHTINIAREAVCNGHLNSFAPGHENDSYGPCVDEDKELTELNDCLYSDSSTALFVSAEQYAEDSGLANIVDECPDTTEIDEDGDSISPKTGRMNFFEKLFN